MGNNIIIIGCGKMGTALLLSIKRSGNYDVCGVEKNNARAENIRKDSEISVYENISQAGMSDIYILAVKPQDMEKAASELAGVISGTSENKLVISIAAGIRSDTLQRIVGCEHCSVVRAMPNTPALLGEGVTAIARTEQTSEDDLREAERIFSTAGITVIVDEKQMDAVAAVSGSGPAYIFHIGALMKDFARDNGIDPESASKLVYQTVIGAGKLMSEHETGDFISLRDDVTSPGGTTQAALEHMSLEGFEKIFKESMSMALKRSSELSKK